MTLVIARKAVHAAGIPLHYSNLGRVARGRLFADWAGRPRGWCYRITCRKACCTTQDITDAKSALWQWRCVEALRLWLALPRARSGSKRQGRIRRRPRAENTVERAAPASLEQRRHISGSAGRSAGPALRSSRYDQASSQPCSQRKPLLLPLPVEPFRYYLYGERTVHLDGCIEVEAAALWRASGLDRTPGSYPVEMPHCAVDLHSRSATAARALATTARTPPRLSKIVPHEHR